MRFNTYIKEDKTVSDALGLKEPGVGDKVSEKERTNAMDLLNKAINIVNDDIDSSDGDKKEILYAKLADLEDKLEKWESDTDPPEATIKGGSEEEPIDDEPEEEEE